MESPLKKPKIADTMEQNPSTPQPTEDQQPPQSPQPPPANISTAAATTSSFLPPATTSSSVPNPNSTPAPEPPTAPQPTEEHQPPQSPQPRPATTSAAAATASSFLPPATTTSSAPNPNSTPAPKPLTAPQPTEEQQPPQSPQPPPATTSAAAATASSFLPPATTTSSAPNPNSTPAPKPPTEPQSPYSHFTLPSPPLPASSASASSSVTAPAPARGGMAIGVPAHNPSTPPPPVASFSSLTSPTYGQQSQIRQPMQGMGMTGTLGTTSSRRPAVLSRPSQSSLRPPTASSQSPASQVSKSEQRWSVIPEDLLILFKLRLFGSDFIAFNGVCSSWRSTRTVPRPFPPPIHCPFRSAPCLIHIHRNSDRCNFFHSIYHDFFSMDIPELYGVKIRSSKYGWLLVSKKPHIFFFNPCTKEKIGLPDLTYFDISSACFTSPPTSNDCLVYVFSGMTSYTRIGVLERGQQNWNFLVNDNNDDFTPSDCSPLLFDGRLYVMGAWGNVGVFDPNNQTWEVLLYPHVPEHNESFYKSFLCELDGRIMAAFLSLNRDRVNLLSLDIEDMIWQPQQSIGDEMLYASCGSAFFKTAAVNGMGNKIYLPIFSGEKGIFYSLRTTNFHSFAGGDLGREMRIPKRNAWIEPCFERVGHENLTW